MERPWHRTTEQTLKIRYELYRISCYYGRRAGPQKLRCVEQGLGINRLGPMSINLDLLRVLYWLESYDYYFQYKLKSLHSLLREKFKMRFIPFIITGAMLSFFNLYAYAKPVMLSSLDEPMQYCEGYTTHTCDQHCKSLGFKHSNCTYAYVQMSSYKFDLTLTCKLQFLCLRVSYPTFY